MQYLQQFKGFDKSYLLPITNSVDLSKVILTNRVNLFCKSEAMISCLLILKIEHRYTDRICKWHVTIKIDIHNKRGILWINCLWTWPFCSDRSLSIYIYYMMSGARTLLGMGLCPNNQTLFTPVALVDIFGLLI